jgi:hypothetical protein
VSRAHRYNKDAKKNFLDELERDIGLDADWPEEETFRTILLQGRF